MTREEAGLLAVAEMLRGGIGHAEMVTCSCRDTSRGHRSGCRAPNAMEAIKTMLAKVELRIACAESPPGALECRACGGIGVVRQRVTDPGLDEALNSGDRSYRP